jgi:hypothetical protein
MKKTRKVAFLQNRDLFACLKMDLGRNDRSPEQVNVLVADVDNIGFQAGQTGLESLCI